jgi:hypothetical protein
MTWVRIDDSSREHRKLLAAGAEAAWFWTCAIMYASTQPQRDGHIPRVMLPALFAPLAAKSRRLAEVLVAVGLFDRDGVDYVVHDYRDYQPDLEAKREAGRQGGLRSGEVRRAKQTGSKPEAHASKQTRTDAEATALNRSQDITEITDPPPLRGGPPLSAVPGATSAPKAKRKTACPESAASREEVMLWLSVWKIPAPEAGSEVDAFLDYHRRERSLFADWGAAWRTWQRNAIRFAAEKKGARGDAKLQPGGGDWEARDAAARAGEEGAA